MTYILYFLSTLVPLVLLDYLWLGHVMRGWYAGQFGGLMRPDVQFGYAGLFYVLYAIGIVYFCIMPHINQSSMYPILLNGFIFGIICYMTYDLTNAATLASFPLSIVIPDILWGGVVTALSAGIGFWWVTNL